jgi:uncharacterized protein YbaR (Trm112 family)
MSRFLGTQIVCPLCKTRFAFEAVHSVNADRRPELRDAILLNEFQSLACPQCGEGFRLAPSFNYMDVGHGQWIVAAPVTGLADWRDREDDALVLFARSYGADAADAAREIGRRMTPRITFGWPALREKILINELGLDDVVVEACKAAVMRSSSKLPFSADTDLRLMNLKGDKLVMAWQRSADGQVGDALGVPKKLYDAIAANADGRWSSLRGEFDGALFVDLNRLLVAQPA